MTTDTKHKFFPRPVEAWEESPTEDDLWRARRWCGPQDEPADLIAAMRDAGYELRWNEALRIHQTAFSRWQGRPEMWTVEIVVWKRAGEFMGRHVYFPFFRNPYPSSRDEALEWAAYGMRNGLIGGQQSAPPGTPPDQPLSPTNE